MTCWLLRVAADNAARRLLIGACLASAASLPGCGPAECWPGKEGGCPAYSGAALAAGAAIAALGGESGGQAEDAPFWRRTLPGPTQRGALSVSGEERAQGWGIHRATLAAPAQAAGRACAPGLVQYGAGNELLGCILAADAIIAGVRVPAGHGFLCRPDEPGCVIYAAAAPGFQVGVLGLSRGWGVTVADGKLRDRLGVDPARMLDLTPRERAGLEAQGLVVGGRRLLRPSVTPAGINGAIAADGSGPAERRAAQFMTVPFGAYNGPSP